MADLGVIGTSTVDSNISDGGGPHPNETIYQAIRIVSSGTVEFKRLVSPQLNTGGAILPVSLTPQSTSQFLVDALRASRNYILNPCVAMNTDVATRDSPLKRAWVRGTVIDSNQQALSRLVLILSDQGTLLGTGTSNPTTGAFEILIYTGRPVTVLAIPTQGDARNAVVHFNVVPVVVPF